MTVLVCNVLNKQAVILFISIDYEKFVSLDKPLKTLICHNIMNLLRS